MMTDILIIIFGLIAIYKTIEGFAILKRRRNAINTNNTSIIANNSSQCKSFKKAS